MSGVFNLTIRETEKGWRFAEAQWYCDDCGIVAAGDVQTAQADTETGICRCGQEISQTTF